MQAATTAGAVIALSKRLAHQQSQEHVDDVSDEEGLEEALEAERKDEKNFDHFWIGVKVGLQSFEKKHREDPKRLQMLAEFDLERSLRRSVFKPDKPYKILWDCFLAMLILYSVISFPYEIGFNVRPVGQIEDFITAMFIIDIFVNFNTAFVNNTTQEFVIRRRYIAAHYLRTWFIIDFASTVPWDTLVSTSHETSKKLVAIRLIRILRLVRVAKLYHIMKSSDRLDKLRFNPAMVSLFVLIIQIFYIVHIFACFWHFIALPQAVGEFPDNWLAAAGLDGAPVKDRYVASFYFVIITMVTIGYGDIHGRNQLERFYCILTQLTGVVVMSALVGKVTTIIVNRNPQAQAFREKMDELKNYFSTLKIPVDQRAHIKKAYAYYLNKKALGTFTASDLLDGLPVTIRNRLVRTLYPEFISSIKFLQSRKTDEAVRMAIVINARPFFARLGDILFDEGDIMNEIVFVQSGLIRLASRDGYRQKNILQWSDVVVGFIEHGRYFGDCEMFKNSTSLVIYSAAKYCCLFSVSHNMMKQALKEDLNTFEMFQARSARRFDKLNTILDDKLRREKDTFEEGEEDYDSEDESHDEATAYNKSPSKPPTQPAQQQATEVDDDKEDEKGGTAANNDNVSMIKSFFDLFAKIYSTSTTNSSNEDDKMITTPRNSRHKHHKRRQYKRGKLTDKQKSNATVDSTLRQHSIAMSKTQSQGTTTSDNHLLLPHREKLYVNGHFRRAQPFHDIEQQSTMALQQSQKKSKIDAILVEFDEKLLTKDQRRLSLQQRQKSATTLIFEERKRVALQSIEKAETLQLISLSSSPRISSSSSKKQSVLKKFADLRNALNAKKIDQGSMQPPLELDLTWLRNRYIIHPEETWKRGWDFFLGMMVMYCMIITPIEAAFNTIIGKEYIFQYILSVIFFIDMFLTFNTAVTIPLHGTDILQVQRSQIAKKYMMSIWFYLDFASAFPFQAFSNDGTSSIARIARIFRLFRLVQVAKALRLSHYIEALEDFFRLPPAFLAISGVLFRIFMLAHWAACCWWGLTTIASHTTWYDNYGPNGFFELKLRNEKVSAQYLMTLYFVFTTFTTVGYGDIYPVNTQERFLCIFLALAGAIIFGFMIAQVSSLLGSLSGTSIQAAETISRVTEFLNEKKVPSSLETEILDQFRFRVAEASAEGLEEILDRLPPMISMSLLRKLHDSKMKEIPFFRYIHKNSVAVYLFKQMTPLLCEPGFDVCKENETCRELMFLITGHAIIFRKMKTHEQLTRRTQHLEHIHVLVQLRRKKMLLELQQSNVKAQQQAKQIEQEIAQQRAQSTLLMTSMDDMQAALSDVHQLQLEIIDSENDEDDDDDNEEKPSPELRQQQHSNGGKATDSSLRKGLSSLFYRRNKFSKVSFVDSDDGHEPFTTLSSNIRRGSGGGAAMPLRGTLQRSLTSQLFNMDMSEDDITSFRDPINTYCRNNDLLLEELDEDHMANIDLGYHKLCDAQPGHFVGHSAFFHPPDDKHPYTMRSTKHSTFYSLSKSALMSLIRQERMVGIRLQAALSRAVIAQASALGKRRLRDTRRLFIHEVKEYAKQMHKRRWRQHCEKRPEEEASCHELNAAYAAMEGRELHDHLSPNANPERRSFIQEQSYQHLHVQLYSQPFAVFEIKLLERLRRISKLEHRQERRELHEDAEGLTTLERKKIGQERRTNRTWKRFFATRHRYAQKAVTDVLHDFGITDQGMATFRHYLSAPFSMFYSQEGTVTNVDVEAENEDEDFDEDDNNSSNIGETEKRVAVEMKKLQEIYAEERKDYEPEEDNTHWAMGRGRSCSFAEIETPTGHAQSPPPRMNSRTLSKRPSTNTGSQKLASKNDRQASDDLYISTATDDDFNRSTSDSNIMRPPALITESYHTYMSHDNFGAGAHAPCTPKAFAAVAAEDAPMVRPRAQSFPSLKNEMWKRHVMGKAVV